MTTYLDNATTNLYLHYDVLTEYVAWHHARVLYSVAYDFRPAGCRIILKTITKNAAEICFINASSAEQCFEVLEAFLTTNNVTGVRWLKDQYYKA